MKTTARAVTAMTAITTGVIAADLGSKSLASRVTLTAVEHVENPGLLLGIAAPSTTVVLLLAVTGIATFGSLLVHGTVTGRLPAWISGLLIGGAVGNLIDRFLLSAVRDFIATPWVVFNLADVALMVGAISYSYVAFQPLRWHHSAAS